MERQTHIISALVEHKPGVLYSVSNMFRRRAFNIESITVGPAEQKDIARMTIVVNADERILEQVVKQLNKLIDVIKVSVLDPAASVVREMVLVKIHTPNSNVRSDVINYVNVFRGRVVDIAPDSLIVEITGDPDKINAFIDLVRNFGIKELARTGVTALSRGLKSVRI
ncbi:MAG TPA: acetolactate synthase small subunit [Candidatus Bathyarchaeota archaeon]|nr:MAG: acetolactate synthase small subunit [Candidatus Bathyarchaeota archaeon B24-2]HDN63217.1 acetolactate synthase small subunit [Candidatus Bathyarchaeota archaeon]